MNQLNHDPLSDDSTTTDSTPDIRSTDRTVGQTPGEGVNAMAPKPRRARKRAWDEMSETDRQVLLDAVRLRREMQATQDARALEFWALRAGR